MPKVVLTCDDPVAQTTRYCRAFGLIWLVGAQGGEAVPARRGASISSNPRRLQQPPPEAHLPRGLISGFATDVQAAVGYSPGKVAPPHAHARPSNTASSNPCRGTSIVSGEVQPAPAE